MARTSPKPNPRSVRRIAKYVASLGSMREAAAALDVDHATLWRAATGKSKASVTLLIALTTHSNKPMGYWAGV